MVSEAEALDSSSSEEADTPKIAMPKQAVAELMTRPKEEKPKWTPPSFVVLVYVLLAFLPRFVLCAFVFVLGQVCRAFAKLFCRSVGAAHLANKRILIVTDYMPPQCHGIATRVSQYTKHLRAAGHEVHVYTCCVESRQRTSFDHATLPYVLNPFNGGNQISYSVGIKLAFALGAESWDVVHIVYPSMLGIFILPCCQWRGIAAYCSHHVDIEYYVHKYVSIPQSKRLEQFTATMIAGLYNLCYKMPASFWSDVNTSMTRSFVEAHLPAASKYTRVGTIGSGIDPTLFHQGRPLGDASSLLWLWCDPDCRDERTALRRRLGAPDEAQVWAMVQRLAPEKETHIAITAVHLHNEQVEALKTTKKRTSSSTKRNTTTNKAYLVIAGDGPARAALEQHAAALEHARDAVVFLGRVKHTAVPVLYRAADLFVTCSRSETFGLTVTEALACGTPVVYPACAVFDELYVAKLPDPWRYDGADEATAPTNLLGAIDAATAADAQRWLDANPVDPSWAAAARDLDGQYSDALSKKRSARQYKPARDAIERRLIHLCRAALFATSAWFVLSFYYRKIACSVVPFASSCASYDDCENISCFRPYRIIAALLLIVAVEWAHC